MWHLPIVQESWPVPSFGEMVSPHLVLSVLLSASYILRNMCQYKLTPYLPMQLIVNKGFCLKKGDAFGMRREVVFADISAERL